MKKENAGDKARSEEAKVEQGIKSLVKLIIFVFVFPCLLLKFVSLMLEFVGWLGRRLIGLLWEAKVKSGVEDS